MFHCSTQGLMGRKDKYLEVLAGQSTMICTTVSSLQDYEQQHDTKERSGAQSGHPDSNPSSANNQFSNPGPTTSFPPL